MHWNFRGLARVYAGAPTRPLLVGVLVLVGSLRVLGPGEAEAPRGSCGSCACGLRDPPIDEIMNVGPGLKGRHVVHRRDGGVDEGAQLRFLRDSVQIAACRVANAMQQEVAQLLADAETEVGPLAMLLGAYAPGVSVKTLCAVERLKLDWFDERGSTASSTHHMDTEWRRSDGSLESV